MIQAIIMMIISWSVGWSPIRSSLFKDGVSDDQLGSDHSRHSSVFVRWVILIIKMRISQWLSVIMCQTKPEGHGDVSQRRLLQGSGWNARQEPRCQKTTTVLQHYCHGFRDENENDDDNWFGSWYPQLPRDFTVGNVVDKTSAHCHILAPLQLLFHSLPFDWYFDNTR